MATTSSMTSNLSAITQYDPAASKTAANNALGSTKDMTQNFLKMLTAQLQNQDPMEPTGMGEMTTTLAQLNVVDGINNMSTTLQSLLSQIQSSDFMSQSAVVGKYALSSGNAIQFDGQNYVTLAAELPEAVNSLKASITDANGQVVKSLDLGSSVAGLKEFVWAGLDDAGNALAAGNYTLSLTAANAAGTDVTPTAYVSSMVSSVGRNGSDVALNLIDGRTLAPADVVRWVV